MKNSQRYARQVSLPEIGIEGQEKLAHAKILIIGAGGLGCPALQYLVGAGLGTIGIIDDDAVDISNLQRQVLFQENDKGKLKAAIAKERLSALNPDITINAYCERLTSENALSLLEAYDIIIDGTDNFQSKFLINDAAIKLGKPVIYGSILGFEGQVSVFGTTKEAPCYRCLHPKKPSSYVPNCAEAGVLGALAGIIGSAQAMEAIKLIVAHEEFLSLTGKLWLIDARTMETKSYSIPKDKKCPTCSKKSNDIKLESESMTDFAFPEINTEKARNKNEAIFIDVREKNEWDAGHIEGALFCPLSVLINEEKIPANIPSNKPCIIYCKSGKRSLKAIEILSGHGYKNLINLKGGYLAWSA